LLLLAYPAPGGPTLRYNNFRQVLSSNPCWGWPAGLWNRYPRERKI